MNIDHGVLCDWVRDSEDATADSRKTAEKCRDYYDSKQWTETEASALTKRGQAAVVINRIKPKMDGLFGIEKANRTTAKAFPRTPMHTADADAATEAIRYVLQDNFYSQTRSHAWENMCIEGTGGCDVFVKEVAGEIQIKINPIDWNRIIYDPHSRRRNFSDARYLGHVLWMDYDEAVSMYPEGKDMLEDMISSSSDTYEDVPRWMDTKRRRVKIVELYYRKEGQIYYACFTRGGYLKPEKISPYKDEDGQTEWPYEFQSAFVDRDGNRYGAVLQLLDVQDEINKRRSKAMHLMSVRQVRLEKGAVEDVNKVRQELAKPDGVIETTPMMEFEILKTGDMAAAQFNLLTEAKQEIDAVGVNAAMSGRQEGAASGRALHQREQAGQTEVAIMFDGLKALDVRVYRKVWNRIRQYWTDEKWIRVTDDEQNVKFVALNRPITKGEQELRYAEQAGHPPEHLALMQQRFAQNPLMGEVVGQQNSVSELDVDIIISDAPEVDSMEVEQFQGLAEVIKSGAPPLLVEALIQSSAIPRKEQLLKRLRQEPQIPPQVQEKMQQMQEQAQKMAEELQATKEENQNLKMQDAQGLAKAQHEAQLKAAQIEADRQNAEREFALKAYIQQEEQRLAREKAEAEIALKREVAAADLMIESDRMNAANEQAKQKQDFERQVKAVEFTEKEDKRVMPKVEQNIQMFTKAISEMTKVMQQVAQTQTEILAVQKESLAFAKAPKNIALSNVMRDEAGHVKGATVKPTLQ